MYTDFSDEHTNLAQPKTSATITIRVIKSFQYRTEKSLVLRDLDLTTTTVKKLKEIVIQAVQTQSGWKPYRNVQLGAAGFFPDTTNLIINLDHDEWILDDEDKTLAAYGFGKRPFIHRLPSHLMNTTENETEVSFFNRELYEEFRRNPETSWD
ncbi:hypothetical protein PM082_012782 [Marasmius tenuissimus]|nr:hypothetical protein PM082_012782 [Marasmius tenuissimus]